MRLSLAAALLASLPGCRPDARPSPGPGVLIPAPDGAAAPLATAPLPARSSEGTPPPQPDPDQEGELVMGDAPCKSDADCVPAQCCHAVACVSRGVAPACGKAICTMDCRGGTMDCGGGCLCHEGRCAARLAPKRRLQRGPAPDR